MRYATDNGVLVGHDGEGIGDQSMISIARVQLLCSLFVSLLACVSVSGCLTISGGSDGRIQYAGEWAGVRCSGELSEDRHYCRLDSSELLREVGQTDGHSYKAQNRLR